METSALKRLQEQESPRTGKELLPHINANRQAPVIRSPHPLHPLPFPEEPGRGTLICRISSSFEFNFETRVSLDFAMRYAIPHGMGIHQKMPDALRKNAPELLNEVTSISPSLPTPDPERHLLAMGTLGGGKNFIEIARSGRIHYLIVHADARTLGQEIKKICQAGMENLFNLSFSDSPALPAPLKSMERNLQIARRFGQWNRRLIAQELLGELCEEMTDSLQENGEMPPVQELMSLYRFQVP